MQFLTPTPCKQDIAGALWYWIFSHALQITETIWLSLWFSLHPGFHAFVFILLY